MGQGAFKRRLEIVKSEIDMGCFVRGQGGGYGGFAGFLGSGGGIVSAMFQSLAPGSGW